MIVGIVVAVMPWANAMLQRLTHEQALKEREEERADMTAHLHDGVLQTLALIQLHSEEPTPYSPWRVAKSASCANGCIRTFHIGSFGGSRIEADRRRGGGRARQAD